MFLCSSWHYVLDIGLFMVFRHVQRNGFPRRFVFDYSVTTQCFWFRLLLPNAMGVGFSSHFTTVFFSRARASPQEWFGGSPALVNVLLRSWCRHTEPLPGPRRCSRIPSVHLLNTVAQEHGIPKTSATEDSILRLPDHELDYPLIVAFRSSRL